MNYVRGRKRPYFFIKHVIFYLIILNLLFLGILAFFMEISYRDMKERISESADKVLQVYENQLNNQILRYERDLMMLMNQDVMISQLGSHREMTSYFAAVSIKQYLEEIKLFDDSFDWLSVIEQTSGIIVAVADEELGYQQKKQLEDYTLKLLDAEPNIQWQCLNLGNKNYLCKSVKKGGQAILITIGEVAFVHDIVSDKQENQEYAFWIEDSERNIFAGDRNSTENCEIIKKEIGDSGIYLSLCVPQMTIWDLKENGKLIIVILLAMEIVLGIYLIWYLQRQMILPIRHMTEGINRIQSGDSGWRIPYSNVNDEMDLLEHSFNQMMDVMIQLRIRDYEKKLQLQDTELKCYRLQIKPHFFLNALTTISSLNEQGKSGHIREFVESFSTNIRYLFQVGLHTVKVGDELEHIEQYFVMQEMRYPGCVFHFVEISDELKEWRIPQLLIHTIIENEFKYAVSIDRLLSVFILVEKRIHQGEAMLYVRIEDDGVGYPREIIELINYAKENPNSDGRKLGLWNIKRTLELMYDSEGLFHISNGETGGCLNEIWIPGECSLEKQEDKNESIDCR